MYTSDEFTPLAIFFVITILNAVSMIFVWRLHYREDATRLWATSNLFAAASAFAYLLRPVMPETLSVLSGYLAGVAGIFIFACGIARFFRRPAPWRLGIFVTLGVFIAACLCIGLGLEVRWRFLFYSSGIILGNLTALGYLLRAPELTPGQAVEVQMVDGRARFVVSFVAIVFSFGWVLITLAEFPEIAPGLSKSSAQLIWLSINIVGGALLPMSQLLMVSERLVGSLDRQARFDDLTGALTRRAFLERFQEERARAMRHRLETSLCMIDLDDFKNVNDRYGHTAGDQALRHFASVARYSMRQEDILGRIGGDEFSLLLPETSLSEAVIIADRIRDAIAKSEIIFGPHKFTMTVSIGAIGVSFDDMDPEAAIMAADALLYEAKRAGRNRVQT
jgi:diguanylate cyclase (GGDEF)-like protein